MQRPPPRPDTQPGEAWFAAAAGETSADEQLRRLLERIRAAAGAARAVLWDTDPEGLRARPAFVAGGPPPGPVPLRGDPLHWVWQEGVPIRLERAPSWTATDGGTWVLPLTPSTAVATLLTLEYAADAATPDAATSLEPYAALVAAALAALRRETAAVEARRRLDDILATVRDLPRHLAAERVAPQLADAARRLVAGTGALVAIWSETTGEVVATAGEDGGPRVGSTIEADTELALAARAGAPIVREDPRRRASAPPLATRDERWAGRPLTLAVVPLSDAHNRVLGLVAAWSSSARRLDEAGLDALRSIAPYAALQLQHAVEFSSARRSAVLDPLTALANRRAFDERFADSAAHFRRYRRPLALLLLDLDHFKRVNDSLGHEAGDAVLRAAAGALAACVRETDLAARFGGEEFAILAHEASLAEAARLAERARQAVEALRVEWGGKPVPVRVSIGVAACPESVEDPAELIAAADAALYRAKEEGRNRVTTAADEP